MPKIERVTGVARADAGGAKLGSRGEGNKRKRMSKRLSSSDCSCRNCLFHSKRVKDQRLFSAPLWSVDYQKLDSGVLRCYPFEDGRFQQFTLLDRPWQLLARARKLAKIGKMEEYEGPHAKACFCHLCELERRTQKEVDRLLAAM